MAVDSCGQGAFPEICGCEKSLHNDKQVATHTHRLGARKKHEKCTLTIGLLQKILCFTWHCAHIPEYHLNIFTAINGCTLFRYVSLQTNRTKRINETGSKFFGFAPTMYNA